MGVIANIKINVQSRETQAPSLKQKGRFVVTATSAGSAAAGAGGSAVSPAGFNALPQCLTADTTHCCLL